MAQNVPDEPLADAAGCLLDDVIEVAV